MTYSNRKILWEIFITSILLLFYEMMIIRWIGTEVRIFAYLQNIILITCYLGMGIGCFTSERKASFRNFVLPLTFLAFLFMFPQTKSACDQISLSLSIFDDMNIWFKGSTTGLETSKVIYGVLLTGIILTGIILTLILFSFIPIGRKLSSLLDSSPTTIKAYSVNIFGSMIGIWAFVLAGFWELPPFYWILTTFFLALLLFKGEIFRSVTNLFLMAICSVLFFLTNFSETYVKQFWSPYQKLTLKQTSHAPNSYELLINNVGYQLLLDISEKNVREHPEVFPSNLSGYSLYDMPLRFNPKASNMLIIGAGTGNDASAALRHGVKQITAVDIDPTIIKIGRKYHPEHPYSNPRVTVVNDDARSFFIHDKNKYDVISFGLLDSHTNTSLTNTQLDHYVYTRESLEQAKRLLKPGGVMALSFGMSYDFVVDRMAGLMRDVFGKKPLVLGVPDSAYSWGGIMFISGDGENIAKQLASDSKLKHFVEIWTLNKSLPYTTEVASDDWPYIYLPSRTIPTPYLLIWAVLLLLYFYSAKTYHMPKFLSRANREYYHFFFLGAAFLLLEVQNISKAAVILGNTWLVNAVIISGILLMILFANLIAELYPKVSLTLSYSLLGLSCIFLYFFDLTILLPLPYFWKALAVGVISTLPVFFAGIIFIKLFASAENKARALGVNIFGSLLGGLLQSISFLTGIKFLLLLVISFYAMSYLILLRLPQLKKMLTC